MSGKLDTQMTSPRDTQSPENGTYFHFSVDLKFLFKKKIAKKRGAQNSIETEIVQCYSCNIFTAVLRIYIIISVITYIPVTSSHWPFGGFYCTVNNFVANVTVAASVFTLVAISFDR